MTKKTLTAYGMLFLFAFAFGLSFTLAGDAQAETPCCVVSWCYVPVTWISAQGHMGLNPQTQQIECIITYNNDCDFLYTCADDQ